MKLNFEIQNVKSEIEAGAWNSLAVLSRRNVSQLRSVTRIQRFNDSRFNDSRFNPLPCGKSAVKTAEARNGHKLPGGLAPCKTSPQPLPYKVSASKYKPPQGDTSRHKPLPKNRPHKPCLQASRTGYIASHAPVLSA